MVDVVGPRPDGAMVAAAGGRLHLVRPDGTTSPFGSYSTDPGPESYIAMASGLDVTGAGCRFAAGEVYGIEPVGRQRVVRVTVDGQASPFVETPPTDLLTGITFDTTGRFGNQLLVAGRRDNRTVLFSIDCRGRLRTVTESAPPVEGGMAVAPVMFGQHGGDLIAPDESSGDIVFIRFDGTSGVLIRPDLPAGGDIGVESVGFIPEEFVRRKGAVYIADRRSPGSPTVSSGGSSPTVSSGGSSPTVSSGGSSPTVSSGGSSPTVSSGGSSPTVSSGGSSPTVSSGGSSPTEGTDAIWRMTWEVLGPGGIDENDLVVLTEAGRSAVVRCRETCLVLPLGSAPGAHIEGHVTVVLGDEPPRALRGGALGATVLVIATLVIIAGGFALFFLHNRKIREPDGR